MSKYVLKRVMITLATVFILATLTFVLVNLIPGDPFQSDKLSPAQKERMSEYYGLDKPILEQYAIYLNNLLHGDLGESLKYPGRQVNDMIRETFPVSAIIGLIATFFSEIIGWLFGSLCAQYRNRWPDRVLLLFAILGTALPTMVIGPVIRNVFGVQLKLLPTTGWGSAKHIIMPAFVLGVGMIAGGTRSMRASMLQTSTQDYVKTAMAKGLSPKEVLFHHKLKNSMVPLMPNMGSTIAGVMMGSFVVESIFLVPGMGKYYVDSITALDYSVIMGMTVFYGVFLVTMNFLVDVLYGFVDPRIRVK
ncbi:MAG: ABC transporter permease [Anaerovoracaceae bacterium]